jgi:glycosyltransferase involved in cell wall biosynthesis
MAEPPRIGVLAGSRLAPNFHAFLGNLGELLAGAFRCDLIVRDAHLPARATEHFRVIAYRPPAWPGGTWWADAAALWSYCRTARPDVLINACQPERLGLIVALVGGALRVPTVVRMTGDGFAKGALAPSALGRAKGWVLHRLMAGAAYRRADYVVPGGRILAAALARHVPRRSGSVVVLPQPVDTRRFHAPAAADKAALKRRLGLDAARRTVLFMGRLSYLKGADRLVEIARRVGQASTGFQFCVVGEGDYANALAALPDGLVRLVGPVPHDEVHVYYQAADLVILPSRTEGLPNVVLEAEACAVPVIATAVGEIPTYVSTLATEPEDYARRILAGDWTVDPLPDDWDWERQAAAYREFFTRVSCG